MALVAATIGNKIKLLMITINFENKLPRVPDIDRNGNNYLRTLRSNYELKEMVFNVLHQHSYTFHPISKPVPAVLINWKYVDRNVLVTLLRNVYNFYKFNSDFDTSQLVLTMTGFARSKDASRLLCCQQFGNGLTDRNFLLSWDETSSEIERFFSLPNSNKVMILQ